MSNLISYLGMDSACDSVKFFIIFAIFYVFLQFVLDIIRNMLYNRH